MIETHQDRDQEAERLRRLADVGNGHYIAIVARQRRNPSLVQILHDGGWSGVNVSADASCHVSLREKRPRDRNLHAVIVRELSNTDQPRDEASDSAGVRARKGASAAASTMTLTEVVDSVPGGDVTLLSIDAGGLDPAIIADAGFQALRPRIVIIDDVARGGEREEGHWRTRLADAGYDELSGDGQVLWFCARERGGDLGSERSGSADGWRGRDPAYPLPSTAGGGVKQDGAAGALALARAREELEQLQDRYARQANLHNEVVERLRSELRDAQRRAASLEVLQADSLRLARIATLLDGALSTAVQNYGLETLRRSLVRQVGAWLTEVERDRTDLLFRVEAESHQRHAVLGSTSWRLTAPLRRLGRASRIMLHQPRHVPLLLIRKLRRAAHLAGSDLPGPPGASPAAQGHLGALAETAALIDSELMQTSELLQRLAAIARGRDDGRDSSVSPPGSEAYRAMTHAGRLAAWIRHDVARQRVKQS